MHRLENINFTASVFELKVYIPSGMGGRGESECYVAGMNLLQAFLHGQISIYKCYPGLGASLHKEARFVSLKHTTLHLMPFLSISLL